MIGASSGAALGAAIALMGYIDGIDSDSWKISLAALVGALGAVGLVYLIASVGGNAPTLSLLLAGVAVSSLIGAIVSLLMFMNNDQLLSVFGLDDGELFRHRLAGRANRLAFDGHWLLVLMATVTPLGFSHAR